MQRDADRRQRENESIRSLDEKFAAIVADLCSEKAMIRASAAVSIISFLRPEYHAYHEQVLMVLVENLKLSSDTELNRPLVTAFEKAIKAWLPKAERQKRCLELDLACCSLKRANLSELDLSCVDIYKANLADAKLRGTVLWRAKGWEVSLKKAVLSGATLIEARLQQADCSGANFHDAKLGSADLKAADLRGAEFQGAHLQSAHLDDARLEGANFKQAYLKGAFFIGAKLDDGALRSITNAYDWRDARFDTEVLERLRRLYGQR
jgi:uncharacterized protein YjbI with pentapeptide repeats